MFDSLVEGRMSQQQIMMHLRGINTGNIIEAAMKSLRTPKGIHSFYRGHIEELRKAGLPPMIVNQRVGYMLNRVDEKTAERWREILPDISSDVSHAVYQRCLLRLEGKQLI